LAWLCYFRGTVVLLWLCYLGGGRVLGRSGLLRGSRAAKASHAETRLLLLRRLSLRSNGRWCGLRCGLRRALALSAIALGALRLRNCRQTKG
jgi:hypothetical protein